jgi:hypothetical protein
VPVVDLTTRRLERVENAQKQTNTLLGQCLDVLEARSRHFERMEEAMIGVAERVGGLAARVDRLTVAITRGRMQDLARFDDHERRLRALEHPGRARRRKR